jgi:polyribonucleotide nucleotidyltransferase
MGLILEGERFAVLSDILGDEDHLGDMDFKVAGTANGVTSLQMDIKIAGITEEIMKVALEPGQGRPSAHPRRNVQGADRRPRRAGRTCAAHRDDEDPVDKIREVIGSGGKVIREIVEKTGAKVNIEDDGTIKIASSDGKSIKAAMNWIKSIASDPEVGRSTRAPSSRPPTSALSSTSSAPRTVSSTSRSSPTARLPRPPTSSRKATRSRSS